MWKKFVLRLKFWNGLYNACLTNSRQIKLNFLKHHCKWYACWGRCKVGSAVVAVYKMQKKVCFRLIRESEIPPTKFRRWLLRCSACMEATKRSLCPIWIGSDSDHRIRISHHHFSCPLKKSELHMFTYKPKMS